MKLYDELAKYWPLLSPPAEYREEAAMFGDLLARATGGTEARRVLELGSGGGHLASHLTGRYELTLSDVSPAMLAVSRALNPACEHVEGDMRTLRLGRTFDAILVHDAVAYMTTEDDLRAAMRTAFVHCRPGGGAVFAPDVVADTFEPSTEHGGSDGEDASLRWLEWSLDPDPTDTTIEVHYAVVLRHPSGDARAVHEMHLEGLFPRATWLRVLGDVGWSVEVIRDEWDRELMFARRPT